MSSIVKVDTIQENTSANGITVDGLNIKDSKLVTANSVVASNITADAINATKIADSSIENEHLNVLAITGHTAETSIADGDTILIHDASASALRKMTKANFVSGIGGTNTPSFLARANTNQTINDATSTQIVFGTEYYDTANGFASNTYTIPSGQAGKYHLYFYIDAYDAGDSLVRLIGSLYKNGSTAMESTSFFSEVNNRVFSSGSIVLDLSAGDTLKIHGYLDTADGSTSAAVGDSSEAHTYFGGYKLIE